MTAELYRYHFIRKVTTEDIESALLMAIWNCESLHGEPQTRLDVAHFLDPADCSCTIDAGTPVGRDLNRLFTGLMTREFGPDSFRIERVTNENPQPQETAA